MSVRRRAGREARSQDAGGRDVGGRRAGADRGPGEGGAGGRDLAGGDADGPAASTPVAGADGGLGRGPAGGGDADDRAATTLRLSMPGALPPDDGALPPDDGARAPDDGARAPDHAALPPDHGTGAPDHGAGAFDRAADPVPGRGRRLRRPVRWRPGRLLRRLLIGTSALIVVAIAASGGLLLVTPSVRNAEALARAQDRAHHAVFPGPPVPARFAAAIEATEDHRFGSEPGIDPFAIGRVIAARLTGGIDQGGATIYQQLAKLLYTPGRTGVAVEFEQLALAFKLYMSYSPQQILQMYADVAYFGNGDYGLAAASCGYFGIRPALLSWPQAALLAGLVQAPAADDPLRHPGRARGREEHVLGRLVAVGKLTQAQAAAALAQPLTRLVANSGEGNRCAG